MMREVYERAYSVLAWIGQEKEQDAAGFTLLGTIHERLGRYSDDAAGMLKENLAGPTRTDT